IMKLRSFWISVALASISVAQAVPTKIIGTRLVDSKSVAIEAGSKGLVVVFLSAVCPCSNSHVDELRALQKEFGEFNFIGVHSNVDEAKDPTIHYFQKANLPFPVIQDTGAKLADEFHALKTPHAFVIRQDGSVVYQGGVSDSHEFKNAKKK